jgi:phosphonate transport system substrate-binding protein
MKKFINSLLLVTLSINLFSQNKEFVLATYTYSTNNRLQNIKPLAEYLSKKSGLSFKAVSYPTVQSLINAIKNDSVDFAMMNTSGYLILQRNYPEKVLPLVNLDMGNDSSTNYGGCIIAGRQTGIRTVADLLNNQSKLSFALVNSSSTSGNLVPRLILNSNHISDPESRFDVYYTGTHKKVVDEVLSGKATIGGCGCAEIESAGKNDEFDKQAAVIGQFNNIPLGPIVYNSKLGESISRTILKLLLDLHKNDSAVFQNFCNGWTEFRQAKNFRRVSDKDYDEFRAMFGSNKSLWKLIE